MKNFNNDKTTSTINKNFALNYGDYKTDEVSNKMVYHCAICGKPYDTVDERVACETKCLAARKRAQAEIEKKKLEEKKNTRKAEIEKKYKELATLVNDYCKDYGSLQLGESRYFEDDISTLSKLLGWWF
jgi:hypothetical protein